MQPSRPLTEQAGVAARCAGAIPPAAGVAAVLAALCVASLFVGVGDASLPALLRGDPGAWQVVLVSRVPRAAALILVGAGTATAGLIMQMLAQNRFVEPTTAGTVECALLGLLCGTLLTPDAAPWTRALTGAAFALAGTALFLRVLRLAPLRADVTVPLVGIVYSGIVGAGTSFLAYRYDLLQSLAAWRLGDFSTVLRGRYELLWGLAALVGLAYWAAERFTVAGLGRDMAVGLGLDHRAVTALALTIVSLVTATSVATVGAVPFLGLVVPNLVSLVWGDNLRRTLPIVAVSGATLVLACDVLARLVRYPFEIPVGAMMGVVGSALFLWLLLRRDDRRA